MTMQTYTLCTAIPGDPETATCTLTKMPHGSIHFEVEQDGHTTLDRVDRIFADGDSLVLALAGDSYCEFPETAQDFIQAAGGSFPVDLDYSIPKCEILRDWRKSDGQSGAVLRRDGDHLTFQVHTGDGDWLIFDAFEEMIDGEPSYFVADTNGKVKHLC